MKMEQLSDITLIRRCRRGDEKAFEALYCRYRLPLYSYLNRLLAGRRSQVDDFFQQVWVKATANLERYDDRQRFLAWLCRIGHNLVIDFYRKEGRVEFVELTELLAGDTVAEEAGNQEMLSAALSRAIARLPENQRIIVEMRDHGVSFKEIAEKLAMNINTALGRMRYAVANLRGLLAEEMEKDEHDLS